MSARFRPLDLFRLTVWMLLCVGWECGAVVGASPGAASDAEQASCAMLGGLSVRMADGFLSSLQWRGTSRIGGNPTQYCIYERRNDLAVWIKEGESRNGIRVIEASRDGNEILVECGAQVYDLRLHRSQISEYVEGSLSSRADGKADRSASVRALRNLYSEAKAVF